jgi:DNA-binding transcriptional ArsR family regulator
MLLCLYGIGDTVTYQSPTIKADPLTASIFKALADGEKCLCELKEAVGLPSTWKSYDLMMLEDLNAIKSRTHNGYKYYSLGESRSLWHLRRWTQRQEPQAQEYCRPVELVSRTTPLMAEFEAMLRRGC